MRAKDIASQYGFDARDFERFVSASPTLINMGITPKTIAASDVPKVVELYAKYRARLENKPVEQVSQENLFQSQVDSMVLTTCPTVEGCTVSAQYGPVFGSCLFRETRPGAFDANSPVPDPSASSFFEPPETSALLEKTRNIALYRMKCDAATRGANAIVGVTCDSSVGNGVIRTTVYGTALRILGRNIL